VGKIQKNVERKSKKVGKLKKMAGKKEGG